MPDPVRGPGPERAPSIPAPPIPGVPVPGGPIPRLLPGTVRCRRCGRPLHDPQARMLRLGRECRRPGDPVRVVPGDQEPLPGL